MNINDMDWDEITKVAEREQREYRKQQHPFNLVFDEGCRAALRERLKDLRVAAARQVRRSGQTAEGFGDKSDHRNDVKFLAMIDLLILGKGWRIPEDRP